MLQFEKIFLSNIVETDITCNSDILMDLRVTAYINITNRINEGVHYVFGCDIRPPLTSVFPRC